MGVDDLTNASYRFDQFTDEQKNSEFQRLTANVGSHSEALVRLFFENGFSDAKHILDVGCGTGAMMELFSQLMPEFSIVGVDNSTKMLEAAKGRLNRHEFVLGEANRLPFEEDTFDFVYTRLVLMHNPRPQEIIGEMVRVCKPGGTVCAVEIDDGTQVFHPYGRELSALVRANVEYTRMHGTDRTIGRKLYSYFGLENLQDAKTIVQTRDYSMKAREAEEIPFSIKLALGPDEARRFVAANLLSEEERVHIVNSVIPAFLKDPHRFESCSFMYTFGKKWSNGCR